MTTLAITQDFLNLLLGNADKDECHVDILRFIKNDIFGVTLICDFTSIQELESALKVNPYWELLLDRNDSINFDPHLNASLYDNAFYNRLHEENLFFVSLPVAECNRLSNLRGYIYVSSEDISNSWARIKFIRDYGLLKVTNESSFPTNLKFDSWDKIDSYCIPATSILIFDKYIFTDSNNQRMSDNLLILLEKLCRNSLVKPLMLTILSEFKDDKQILDAHGKIKDYFTLKGITNVDFNIIKHDKSMYPFGFEGLHFRVILTNNLRIKCDDSFNFFKRNGKVNNDADINISLKYCCRRKCFYDKELNQITLYVSRLNNLPAETKFVNTIYYYPDKRNYLFS